MTKQLWIVQEDKDDSDGELYFENDDSRKSVRIVGAIQGEDIRSIESLLQSIQIEPRVVFATDIDKLQNLLDRLRLAEMGGQHHCNDCGALEWVGNELCQSCYQKQQDAEEWERAHPEIRCPPRE